MLAIATLVSWLSSPAQAADWRVPEGIVGQLDLFQTLHNEPPARDAAVIAYVQENVDRLPPFFVAEMARRLYSSDPEKALWWYHVGYIRGLYDAMRCSDKTAASAISILPRIAAEVVDHGANDHAAYRRQGLKAIEWKGIFKSRASPWWICANGERALKNVADGRPAQDPDWLRPRHVWPTIRAKLTADFTTVFIELEPLRSAAPPMRLD